MLALILGLTAGPPAWGQTEDDFADFDSVLPGVPVRPLEDLLREAGEADPVPERIPLQQAAPIAPADDVAPAEAVTAPPTDRVAEPDPELEPEGAPATADATVPPEASEPVWQARGGLRLQVPSGMVLLLDDPDVVLLSDGQPIEAYDGLYVALFRGTEDEAENLLSGSDWQVGPPRPEILADGTAMLRHDISLGSEPSDGYGLLLRTATAQAPDLHAFALILTVNRPGDDPEILAATLAPSPPDAPDHFGALPPEAPEGWTRQVRLGLSLALPPGFAVIGDPGREDILLARGADAEMLASPAPPAGLEATVIGVQPMHARDIAQDQMPVLARSEITLADGALFHRRDFGLEQEGVRIRGLLLHSDAVDASDRRIGVTVIAFNPADEAALLAEVETILATLRMNPSRAFPRPPTALSALNGLFDVSLAGGWRSRFSAPGYRLLSSGSDIAILKAGLAASVALGLDGFAEPPTIREGTFLDLPAQIAEGRASVSVNPMGGQMVLIVPDRCLPGGEPIAITLAGPSRWEDSAGLRAFVDGLRLNLPDGHANCRPVLGADVAPEEPASSRPGPDATLPTPAPPTPTEEPAPATEPSAPISPPQPSAAPDIVEPAPPPVIAPHEDPLARLGAHAAAGDGAAMLELARRLDTGLGLPPDPVAALDWYDRAARAGQVEAMLVIAQRHRVGDGADPDQALAVYWYRTAAEAGSLAAMVETGRYLARGQGVPRDDAQAVMWYRRAAEGGDPEGMTMLSWMLADGRGTARDDVAALNWLQRAASSGLPMAKNHLGVMYRDGRGLPRDLARALTLFVEAANGGDAQGMMNLAFALARGEGGPVESGPAADWLMAALIAGNSAVVDHILARLVDLPVATIRELQIYLQAAGYDPGGVDGRAGPRTRAAAHAWATRL